MAGSRIGLEVMKNLITSMQEDTHVDSRGEAIIRELLHAVSRDEEAFNNLIPLMESAGIACANPDEPAQRENGIHFFSAALNLALSPDPSEGHVGLKATKIIFISYCTTLYGGNRSD